MVLNLCIWNWFNRLNLLATTTPFIPSLHIPSLVKKKRYLDTKTWSFEYVSLKFLILKKLFYGAGSLITYLGISYSSKLGQTETTRTLALTTPPENVHAKLSDKLVPGVYDNYESFMHQVQSDAHSFKPMGEKMGEYTVDQDNETLTFEFYKVYCLERLTSRSVNSRRRDSKTIIVDFSFSWFGTLKALHLLKRKTISGKSC